MITSTMRRSIALVAAAAVALSLSACGTSSGAGKTTISVIAPWAAEQYAPYFTSLAQAYEKAHPDVKVDLTLYADQAYKDKVQVAFTTNALPDIYFAWAGQYAQKFIDAGAATDLTADLAKDGWGDSLIPAAVQSYTIDGKTYAVPVDLIAKFFAYNKKIFADNGVEVPTTVDALIQDCKTFSAAGVTPIAFGNQDGWPALHYLSYLNAAAVPADVLAADYSGKDPKFTDPGYVDALTTFKNIADACFLPGVNGVQNTAARGGFTNGEAAIVFAETGQFQEFTEKGGAPKELADNWGYFNFPGIDGGAGVQTNVVGAPDGLLVNSKTEHKDVVIDFLKFVTSAEQGARMVKELGWISSVQGAVAAGDAIPETVNATQTIVDSTGFDVWLDTATKAPVADAFLTGGEALLDGSKTPQQVIDDVAAAAKSAK